MRRAQDVKASRAGRGSGSTFKTIHGMPLGLVPVDLLVRTTRKLVLCSVYICT